MATKKDLNLIVDLNNELNSLSTIECDLLNKVKDNENIFDEASCTSNISNFLNTNSSVKISEILPGGNENELKNKIFFVTDY